jgi:hypothetical protein
MTEHTTINDFKRPPDHEARMKQARRRAQWDLGSPSWAGVILGAYMNPEADAAALEDEQRD